MANPPQLEQLARDLLTVTNRQVEAFDRIGFLEERLQGLLERIGQLEDRVSRLARIIDRKGPGQRV